MSARDQLVEAYGAWEQWTRREGQAIQEGDWVGVAECQRTKRGLQDTILRFTEAADAEAGAPGLKTQDLQRGLGQIVQRLMLLETHNTRLLADRRQAAESQKAEMENAIRNLSRVKQSYVQPPLVNWHSYS